MSSASCSDSSVCYADPGYDETSNQSQYRNVVVARNPEMTSSRERVRRPIYMRAGAHNAETAKPSVKHPKAKKSKPRFRQITNNKMDAIETIKVPIGIHRSFDVTGVVELSTNANPHNVQDNRAGS